MQGTVTNCRTRGSEPARAELKRATRRPDALGREQRYQSRADFTAKQPSRTQANKTTQIENLSGKPSGKMRPRPRSESRPDQIQVGVGLLTRTS
jgi:hypothetical protein